MLRTALTLAKKGIHVFPCGVRSKAPATPHGFRDASIDPDIIRSWWRCDPSFNVGIATGTVSHLFAVDIDGLDAEASLRALEYERGELPPSVEAITARGRHIYFQMPAAPVPCSAGRVADHIDVKADGGYVLAPPSIHPTGRAYAWSVDSAREIASAPAWLLNLIVDPKANGHEPAPVSQWRDIAANGVAEGARDDTAARLAGHLLRRYVDPIVTYELLICWNEQRCRPPLPARDIERVVDSVASKELRRRGGG